VKDIRKRLEALERKSRYAESIAAVLFETNDGQWELTINGDVLVYGSEAAARAAFERKTGPDSVLIIW
jgi:hypothetical protein